MKAIVDRKENRPSPNHSLNGVPHSTHDEQIGIQTASNHNMETCI